MQFFCYHRDRPGSGPLREDLREEHWSYMDGFDDRLLARGPTYEGETVTGSVHVVEVTGPVEARAFALGEPGWQAGAYRDVLVRRWRDLLGRTMWDFAGGRDGGERFLVLGLGPRDPDGHDALPERGDDLIAYGSLLSDDGTVWLGSAALVRAADAADARSVLGEAAYDAVEVHHWQFGGRR